MTAMLDAALAYAARGWPVFPCKPGEKVPATLHGVLDATTDRDQITAWWTAAPDRNVAIATGAPGPDVVDVDVKDGNGYDALAQLTAAGIIEHPVCVATPSGGLHAYHAGSDQRNGTIRKRSIDFRGKGGYVLAAPSVIGGQPYKPLGDLEHVQLVTAVDWRAVRALLDPPPDPPPFTQPAREQPQAEGLRPGDDWASKATWAEILAPHGWRAVRQLGTGITGWCRPGKTGRLISATTRDQGGLYVFSTSTEFETEVPYSKFGAYTLLEHGGDHSAAAAQLRRDGYGDQQAPAAFLQPVSVPPDSTRTALPDYDLGALAARGIKEPDRIAGGMLYPGSVHCLAGAPGGGKTTLMAWWMLRHIRSGGSVMLLDEESGPEQAAEKFLDLGATPDELRSPRFTYVPFPARNWNTSDLIQLHELISERKPGIIGWDSVAAFLAMAGQDENSATDVTAFWQRVLVPCARQYDAAVVGVDHITKNGEHGGYGRGSGAKKAASDVQYIMETIKPFSRTQNGILRLTTAPGKDRRGWLAQAYEIHVRVGNPVTIEIAEAAADTGEALEEMKPAKAKLWEALNAIATEVTPATSDQLVNWIKKKYDHGLRRPTCSTYLNELAADGLADSVRRGSDRSKFWYPLQVSASDDASPDARLSASAPLEGADDDDDTSRTAPQQTRRSA